MVAGISVAAVDLLLRTLRVCKYHCTCDRDVCAFFDCDTRRWNSNLSGCAFARVFFKSRCLTHSLRHNARSDLFRRRLHNTANVVVARTDYIHNYYRGLERGWFYLVESSRTVVTTNMAGYSSTPLAKKLGIKIGSRIGLVNEPKNLKSELGKLPDNAEFVQRLTKSLDIILFFVLSERELARDFTKLAKNLATNGMIWIAW